MYTLQSGVTKRIYSSPTPHSVTLDTYIVFPKSTKREPKSVCRGQTLRVVIFLVTEPHQDRDGDWSVTHWNPFNIGRNQHSLVTKTLDRCAVLGDFSKRSLTLKGHRPDL